MLKSLIHTIVIAYGVEYRKLQLKNLSHFEGARIYHGTTFIESQLCIDEVIVVGGGNSAGQAAVFLAGISKRIHRLIVSGGLAESMSRYLIRQIEETPTIVVRPNTEIVTLDGDKYLESVLCEIIKQGKLMSTRLVTCLS